MPPLPIRTPAHRTGPRKSRTESTLSAAQIEGGAYTDVVEGIVDWAVSARFVIEFEQWMSHMHGAPSTRSQEERWGNEIAETIAACRRFRQGRSNPVEFALRIYHSRAGEAFRAKAKFGTPEEFTAQQTISRAGPRKRTASATTTLHPLNENSRTNRGWVLISVSNDERQHAGHEGYDDEISSRYSWDSTVPNHAQIDDGDLVVVRDSQQPIGIAQISTIDVFAGSEKVRYRCPTCNTTKIRARKSVLPTYRCGECAWEFETPNSEVVAVTRYVANLSNFRLLGGKIQLNELRNCLFHPRGQHAMSEVDLVQLSTLLSQRNIELP